MTVFAVVDVLDTFMAIGHYEYRITVVTHGSADVQVAAVAYELLADVVDGLGKVLGFPDEVSTARGVVWALALVLALVAVSVWLYRVWGTLQMEPATLGWLGATVVLKVLSAVYGGIAAPPHPSIGGVLATRPVAYPLWMVSTVVLVVAAVRVAGTIRRTTVA